jgi:hypothetical protein
MASVSTTYVSTSTYSLSVRIGSSGQLIVDLINGAGTNYRRLSLTGFRAAYSGAWVFLHVTWDGLAAPIVYVNGIAQTMAETTLGTAPAWTTAVDDDYLVWGVFAATDFFNGRMITFGPINGVLTAAEILTHVLTGTLPRWCDIGTGSTVASYSVNWTAGVDGSIAVRATITGANNAVSDGTISKDNCLKCYADGSANTTHFFVSTVKPGFVPGQKYRVAGFYYVPSAQTHVNGINVGNSTIAGDPAAVTLQLSTVGAWTAFTLEFVAVAYSSRMIVFYATAGGNINFTGANSASDDRFFLQGLSYTPIAPLFKPYIESAAVVDLGTNALAISLTAGVAPVTQAPNAAQVPYTDTYAVGYTNLQTLMDAYVNWVLNCGDIVGYNAADFQTASAKLTAIAALANAAGFLKNDGAGNLTWDPLPAESVGGKLTLWSSFF